MTDRLKSFFSRGLAAPTQQDSTIDAAQNDNSVLLQMVKPREGQTYDEWGFDQALKQMGSFLAYATCWKLLKEDYRRNQHSRCEEDEKRIAQAKSDYEVKEVERRNLESLIEALKGKISDYQYKIQHLKQDIIDINSSPATKDGASWVSFIIGLVILVGLTIYLFMFYTSATYSAFFKDFTPEDNEVAKAIFDAQALSKAWEDGVMELLLILTIPFAFLGLGYLIHKFQEQEGWAKYVKIMLLMLITFVFDAILAYSIEEKIYKVEQMGALTDMVEYSVGMALTTPAFWMIIFAGFVVYVIWGFVFDFTMDGYDKLDVVKQKVLAKEREIRNIQDHIEECNGEISVQTKKIGEIETKMVELQNIINGFTLFFSWTEFYVCIDHFTTGWTQWMNANKRMKEDIDKILEENERLKKEHKKLIDAKNANQVVE